MEKKINFSFRFLLRALAAWIITVLPLLFIAAFIANKLSVDTSGLAYISAALSSIAAAAAGARGVSAWQGARGVSAWQGARLVCGLLCGGFITILLLMLGFIIAGGELSSGGVMSTASFTIAGCVLGSMLGGHGRKKKKSTVSVGRR